MVMTQEGNALMPIGTQLNVEYNNLLGLHYETNPTLIPSYLPEVVLQSSS